MKAKELADILMQEPDAEIRMALDFKSLWGVKVKKGTAYGKPLVVFFQSTMEHTKFEDTKNIEEMKA